MATSYQGMDYAIVAGADLSASQYCAVTHAGGIAATGQTFGGIMQGKPLSGEHGAARMIGVTKFRAGNAVAVGDYITPTTSGYLIKCNSGFVFVGECMVAASSGGFGSALLRGKYSVASL
jgi:hypothetical protein